MASQTNTEIKSLKTAPSSEKKSVGFFKRHLGHNRRRSSVSFPNAQPRPVSPVLQAHEPRNATRKASVSSNNELKQVLTNATDGTSELKQVGTKDTDNTTDTTGTTGTNGNVASGEETGELTRTTSRPGGIKWAAEYPETRPYPRARRTSSAGTRRSSIFLRIEGGYVEGVDAGVGSKARRLSVAIPDELRVDECPLNDHFSLFSRAGKKDIGEGGAAVVRLMQSKTAGTGKDKLFAVKEFREREPDDEEQWEYDRKIKSEYAIAKSCSHPNIVETYRLCYSDKKWFHVMEYCDLGDLNDIINAGYFSREDRNCMFKQLLRGVEHLHSRGIAHRDLKSENLLLTKTGCLKIADFGTAEVFSGTHPGVTGCKSKAVISEKAEIRLCKPGMVGSRPYMAPEILKHDVDYDPRGVDVWSCAIVYLTLCIGGTPWDHASTDINNYNIYCHTWDEWLQKYPDGHIVKGRELPKFAATRQFQMLDDAGTKRLIMGMLHPDPAKRWSAHDALETVTVTEYPCCQQEGYSDDIKTRQRKALHNHVPPKAAKGARFLKPK